MKYYLVYLLNYKESDQISIRDSYHNKEDAIHSLERNAVEYIREIQGKQQADICKQEKPIDEILSDIKLREGLYIKKEGNDSIILYPSKLGCTPSSPYFLSNPLDSLTIAV